MALPDNNRNPNLDSGSSRPPLPLRSRIAATIKTSLIFIEDSNTINEDGPTIIKSLVFRVGQTEGSIMFDVTSGPESQRDFFKIIATQFPTRWGVAFHMEGNREIIEVQLLEAEKRQHALEHGMLFPQDNGCNLPTPALDNDAKIIRLNLSHLPFCHEEEILIGLRKSLNIFGRIVDSAEADIPYALLTHNVPWWNSPSRGFRATWHDMPPFSTYRHDATGTHIARDCPKTRHHKRTKIVPVKVQPKCWECDSTKHLRHACPLKKPRRTPTSPTFSDYITPDVDPTYRDLMDITEPLVLDSEDMDMNAIPERKDNLSDSQLEACLFDALDNTYQSTSTPTETVVSGDCINSSPNNGVSSM
ncbi:hypothetical protein INT47_006047 [Mucor saturninus]|uniref:Uncharacterized protein n=1 Tax=Mucor saturninus TaxID=64648 RepID=A0A8H7URH7_9FUNG|nr:hypothetical protein INT47_006047 [Mucor saturninus]